MAQVIEGLPDCQQILEAVSAVLNLEATLMNDQMVRIAGTGPCRHRIGEQLHPDSAFGQALKSGMTIRVDNPRDDHICKSCGLRSLCRETAHVANPIFGEEPVGVLGLVAFTDAQRKQLLHGLDRYADFLDNISRLIGDLLYTRGTLQAVTNSVTEGLIALNEKGSVTFLNEPAKKLLGIPSGQQLRHVTDLPGIGPIFQKAWAEGKRLTSDQFAIQKPQLLSGKILPIQVMARAEGALIVFHPDAPKPSDCEFNRIVHKSVEMADVIRRAKRVAETDATVLIQGESGTGKELLARAIHDASSRNDGPFIAVNCAAIPESLLESEWFGYAGGAFTGAKKGGNPGKFELAHKGTIFLDEVGDMSPALQAKLLRVVQEREVTRIGDTKPVKLDVRIIAAANQELEGKVEQKTFREDLFYRLHVFPIEVPPLRQRLDDLLPLAEEMLRQKAGTDLTLSSELKEYLLGYNWPGNVRELENAMEHATIMSKGPVIGPEALPRKDYRGNLVHRKNEKLTSLKELERQELTRGIEKYGTGDQATSRIALELGISRSTVYRRLKEYGLI